MTTKNRSLEAKLESLLPNWQSFDIQFHGLIRESEGGWSVNDSWKAASGYDRQEAIRLLRDRWEVFKINYLPKARVQDIQDSEFEHEGCNLDVDYTAFASVTETKP